MFDRLTGLNTGNAWVGQLTRPGGLNNFSVQNLFGAPLGGSRPSFPIGGFNVANLFGPPVGGVSPFWQQALQPQPIVRSNFFLPTPSLGISNPAATQILGLISGIRSGGGSFGLGAISNQGTVLTGGLQALPQPFNGRPRF